MTPDNLYNWRLNHELTQESAAQLLDVSISTWRKWEYGINPIPKMLHHALNDIERALDKT